MRLNVEIKGVVYEEFARNCASEGRSLSDVIRSLVINWNKDKRSEEMQKMQSLRMAELTNLEEQAR